MVRSFELGERVFDDEKQLFAHISAIEENKIKLVMIPNDILLNNRLFGFKGKMFQDCTCWETEKIDALYQEVEDKTDIDGNPIFYDHNVKGSYFYYSPKREEFFPIGEAKDRRFWVVIHRLTECENNKEFAIRENIDAAKSLKNALKTKFLELNKGDYNVIDEPMRFHAHIDDDIDEIDIDVLPYEEMSDEAFIDVMLSKSML